MDFAKIIDDYISNRKNKPRGRYIGASGIGRSCARAVWYDYNEVLGIPLSPQEERTMETGRKLEGMIVDYIVSAGFFVDQPNINNNFLKLVCVDNPSFQGHMDGILHLSDNIKVVLEIKTAKNERFEKYIKDSEGVRSWSPVYYAQIQAYMGMSGLNQTLFCVLNKNNGAWKMEWVNYNDIFYHELKTKALSISTIDEPPIKINNSPFYYACRQCKFREICHG